MIEVDRVDVSFGDVGILDDVSLGVEAGEFVGLVGPNGAGKTTLLRTITGAVTPDAGCVSVAGDDVHALSSGAASRRVATVPQDTSVRFGFDVEDVVAMGRTPHRSRFGGDPDKAEHVADALAQTRTARFRDRRIDTLSGGERQRVFIARALAQDAPALVLDEPTASLDVNHAMQTLSLVRDLAGDGRAVVAAIHDLDAAARFCDRLALVHDGRIVDAGHPEEVLTTQSLDAAFDARGVVTTNPVTGSPTVTALPATTAGTKRVHVLGGGEVGATVVGECWAAGHSVTAGPYHDGDAALPVAQRLDVPVESVPPFGTIDEQTLDAVTRQVRDADVTVLADVTIDPACAVLDVADAANQLLVVESSPVSDRNYAGPVGRRRYEELRSTGTVVEPGTLPSVLRDTDEREPVVADD